MENKWDVHPTFANQEVFRPLLQIRSPAIDFTKKKHGTLLWYPELKT